MILRAVNHLNGFDVDNRSIKVELAVEKRATSRRGPRAPGGAPFGSLPGQSRQTDFPLRILVQSDMVMIIVIIIGIYSLFECY